MNPQVQFAVHGEARAGLLGRLVGYFSQRDLSSPDMTVTSHGGEMRVELVTAELSVQAARTIAEKIGGLVGISRVCLEIREMAEV